MNGDETSDFQTLIAQMRAGDAAARERVRNELINRSYERLRRVAKKIFHEDFPRLRNLHETDSITDEAVARLLVALGEVPLETVYSFLGLAALQIRRVLLDMARKAKPVKQAPGAAGATPSPDLADSTTNDPVKLAQWEDFHQKVAELPEDERQVFQLCWYGELTQEEVARELGLHPKKVSRLKIAAIRRLPDWAIELVRD
jgi:RNA polymerase sigma factor (sigma-70 family)